MDRPSRSYTGVVAGVGRDRRVAGSKLLIIDDDRAFVVLAATILRHEGYKVLEAHDATQGFMFAQYDPPDVMLLDMQMPAGGGMNVLERVKSHPRLSQVPIIVVTASTDASLPEQVRSLGAVDLLPKPLDRDNLLDMVRRVLERDQPKS